MCREEGLKMNDISHKMIGKKKLDSTSMKTNKKKAGKTNRVTVYAIKTVFIEHGRGFERCRGVQ